MANTIRLKRASGSDPGASDLVTGEIAVRTDTGKLFTKKDDNSVTEIGVTALGDNDVTTAKIADDAVTFAKLENVENNRILGRVSSGAGNAEELTQSQVRTLLNVENGATADQSASEIVALIADQTIAPSTIDMEDDEKIKLGTGDDLQIYHDGSDSFIEDAGTGTLRILSDDVRIMNAAGTEISAQFIQDGEARLKFDNSTKLATKTGGVDVTGNITVSGTVDGRDVATDGSKLDGIASGATNVSTENIQDIVGGMVTGNTETGITVTYQDGDGTLDFVVGTLNQDTTGNAATATALETARNIGGVSFDGTGNINLPGVNTSGNQDTSGNAATATKLATARTIAGVSFDGSANISLNNNAITNGAGYITSADGGNAATLDSIDSSQFLRSDTADSASGLLTLSGGLALSGKVGAAITAASDGSTITLDLGANTHQSVTLGGNRTFAAPSNQTVGQSGSIFITQDGTGSRTASFNSAFKFVGGTAPTLSTAASAVDRIDYVIKSSNVIHCAVSLDIK